VKMKEYAGVAEDFAALDQQARLDLALKVERRFRIRFSDDEIESLVHLNWPEFVQMTKKLLKRTRVTRLPTRQDVLNVLAEVRGTTDVIEDIESMELLWLLNSMEQRYGVTLDIGEAELARMRTVDGAVGVLVSCVA
jgi:acyl carrier protein